jgi:hypothetical protein
MKLPTKVTLMADRPDDSRYQIPDSEPCDEPKLTTTAATKLGETAGRRYKKIAQACGMSDAELYRLILNRAFILFKHWDERLNPKYFIDQFEVRDEPTFFFDDDHGKLRSKR